MGLNLEQQHAVEYLAGPLLVLAGPGTGKTQLLSAKVAYILKETDTRPENILCLTFTEAGAQNMRDRLQSMIGQDALNVNIYTYHAFGSDILGRYQNYAENFDRKLDAPIDETVQYRLISDIQKTLPATDILKDAEVKQILEVISNAKSARLTAADLEKIALQNIEDSRELSSEISPLLLALPPRSKFDVALETTYQPILDILLRHSTPQPVAGNVERLANVLAKELNKTIAEASAEVKPKVSRLSKWRDSFFEKALENPRDPNSICYRLKDHIANKKLYSIAKLMAKYEAQLAKTGLFDFDDMIECAIQYLKSDRGFQLQMSELFQYILLDEFQDTNPSQFELIKLLTDYEKPIVMAVGDDDQAIYAFQGANYSNLREFQEYYKAEVVTLLDNYRSTGEILNLSHQLADQIDDSFAKNYQINKTLRSMKDVWSEGARKPALVRRDEFPGAVAEYYWVANEIRKLLDGGEDPTEIAIIAPKHKTLLAILPYLKAKNIDITYEKRDNLLQDTQMLMLITLAKFVKRLANREQPVENLLEILSFPFWQIPPEVALRAVEQKWGSNKTVLEYLSGDPDLEQIGNFLAELATLSISTPLELWLDYLIGTLPLPSGQRYQSPFLAYYQKQSSEVELLEFYENLATFRQKILTHANNLHPNVTDFVPKLADFVATIADYEFAGTPIMRNSIYRDDSKAIQVMTAHKSKGLEFKNVFLISVDDKSWGKAEGNNNRLSLPKNLAYIRHTGITDDEQLRLFFVAVTRAKERLIMTNSKAKEDGSNIPRLRYLCESSRDDDKQNSPFLREEVREIWNHDEELSTTQKIETMRLNWVTAYQKLEPNAMELLKERVKDYRLTASDLTNFINLNYAGPQQIYQKCVLHAPSKPTNFSQVYGNIVHTVFEQVTSQGIDNATALELFKAEASHAILSDEDRQSLLEKGENNLTVALTEFAEILRHPGAKAEVNLASEKLVWQGIPLTGKLDHIEIDNEHKTIEIYDYKTGTYHRDKWNSLMPLYRYRLQLGFYKILLNLSLNYRNYKVTRGHILFVTPDADNRVYDKVYDFNAPEEEELKDIMRAVYYQITSLDFVNDPELFVMPEQNLSRAKNLEFIQKLIEKTPKK